MAVTALHTAATGMNAISTQIDVIANNLANANTTGFKAARVNFEDLLYQEKAQPGVENANGDERPAGIFVGLGVKVANTDFNFEQGSGTLNAVHEFLRGLGVRPLDALAVASLQFIVDRVDPLKCFRPASLVAVVVHVVQQRTLLSVQRALGGVVRLDKTVYVKRQVVVEPDRAVTLVGCCDRHIERGVDIRADHGHGREVFARPAAPPALGDPVVAAAASAVNEQVASLGSHDRAERERAGTEQSQRILAGQVKRLALGK